jgi:hypothetical protein
VITVSEIDAVRVRVVHFDRYPSTRFPVTTKHVPFDHETFSRLVRSGDLNVR